MDAPNTEHTILTIVAIWFVAVVAVLGAIGYVIVHFVSKWW